MGRVKADGRGGFYWDPNDTGVDQSGGTWSPGPVDTAPGPSGPSDQPNITLKPGPYDYQPFDTAGGGAPAAPAAPQVNYDRYNVPLGFDIQKWQNPQYHSLKYDTGRALQQYGTQNSGQIQAAVNAVKALYPQYDVSYGGQGDRLMIGGRPVDVSQGFASGRGRLNWQDAGSAAANGGVPAYVPPGTSYQYPGFQAPQIPGQPTAGNLANNVLATLFPNGTAPAGLLDQLLALYQQWVGAQNKVPIEAQINALLNGNLPGAKTTTVTGAKTGVK